MREKVGGEVAEELDDGVEAFAHLVVVHEGRDEVLSDDGHH